MGDGVGGRVCCDRLGVGGDVQTYEMSSKSSNDVQRKFTLGIKQIGTIFQSKVNIMNGCSSNH